MLGGHWHHSLIGSGESRGNADLVYISVELLDAHLVVGMPCVLPRSL
jgi:hypothetical protein